MNILKKIALVILCLASVFNNLNAQNKLSINALYMPGYSRTSGFEVGASTSASMTVFDHNFNLQLEYQVLPSLSLVGGMGFLNSGSQYEISSTTSPAIGSPSPLPGFLIDIQTDYFVFNFGTKFYLQQFFISPEFSLGFLNKSFLTISEIDAFGNTNRIDFGMLQTRQKFKNKSLIYSLSAGYEFRLRRSAFLLGLRGFYVPSEQSDNISPQEFGLLGMGFLFGYKVNIN